MSLYKDPIDVILAEIKVKNPSVTLVRSEYTFGVPTPVAEDAKLTNTELVITAAGQQTPYAGSDTIRYRRLPLSDLASLVTLSVKGNGLATTVDVALLLNALYGTNFTAADIESAPTNLVNGAGTVTLTAKSSSLGWIGSVQVPVEPGRYQLENYLTTTTLPGLYYPEADLTKPFAWGYSYWLDCSAQSSALGSLVEQDTGVQTVLKDALVALFGDAWTTDGPSRYSVAGARTIYNGVTEGRTDVNTDYDFVAIVRLDATQCLGLSGNLTLHYN